MRYLRHAAQAGFRRKTKHPTILRMAQPPQAAAPHKRTKRHLSGDELLRLLNEYAFSGLSWHKWMNVHRADHHRNELEALKHELLATYALPIHPTLTCPGAYIPLYHLTVTLLQELIDCHLLSYREDDIMLNYPVKISFDGRKVLRHKNIGWLVGFPTITTNSQSPVHQHTWALADLPETELRHHPIWKEIQIDADIHRFHSQPIALTHHIVTLDPVVVGDWKSLCYMFLVSQANTRQEHARICGWCHTTKGYLINQWFLPGKLFQECPIIDGTVAAIPSLRASEVCYCAMHGCNRLLDNCLQLITSIAEKDAVTNVVHKVASKWVAHGHKGRLQCFEMKKFWEHNLDPQVIACFTTHTKPCAVLVRTANGVERAEWTQRDLVARLLGACRVYYSVSYTMHPSHEQHCALRDARDTILSATAHFRRRLPATTHWLTTHFLDFIRIDRTAYITLQEGPEHHHKVDDAEAHLTYTIPQGQHMPFTRYEQVLRRYELQRILRSHCADRLSEHQHK